MNSFIHGQMDTSGKVRRRCLRFEAWQKWRKLVSINGNKKVRKEEINLWVFIHTFIPPHSSFHSSHPPSMKTN